MSHQGLRYPGIDAVHGHMISVISRPAQSQFRHISRADDQCILLVGNIHEHLGTLSGLSVLIGDIMALHILTDIRKMSGDRFPDIHLPQCSSQRLRQQTGILISPVCCSETGHGHCNDPRPRKSQQIKSAHRDQKCQCGIQSSGDPQDRRLASDMFISFFQSAGLNG